MLIQLAPSAYFRTLVIKILGESGALYDVAVDTSCDAKWTCRNVGIRLVEWTVKIWRGKQSSLFWKCHKMLILRSLNKISPNFTFIWRLFIFVFTFGSSSSLSCRPILNGTALSGNLSEFTDNVTTLINNQIAIWPKWNSPEFYVHMTSNRYIWRNLRQ
jgi:hypothetical protein